MIAPLPESERIPPSQRPKRPSSAGPRYRESDRAAPPRPRPPRPASAQGGRRLSARSLARRDVGPELATPSVEATRGSGRDPVSEHFVGRVNSNMGIIARGDQVYAIPFKPPPRVEPPRERKPTEYRESFQQRRDMYCSMDQKPLLPYKWNSPRSTCAMPRYKRPSRNNSNITFKGGMDATRSKAFLTTQRQNFTGAPQDYTTNPGIRAQSARIHNRSVGF